MIDLVKALRNRATWETATGITEPHQHIDWMAADEITQLREENARYKLTYAKYVEATDRMNGAPCEQIRHQQEVDALREENARLLGLLREAHVKMDANNLWSNLRNRVAAAIREGGREE